MKSFVFFDRVVVVFTTCLVLSACVNAPPPTEAELKAQDTRARAEQLIRLGDTTAVGGDRATALAFYERAARTAPNWSDAHLRLGKVALAGGNFDKAVSAFEKASALAPRDMDVLSSLGKAYIAAGDIVQAEDTYQTLLNLHPDTISALNGLGVARDLQLDHAGAQSYYRQALDLASNNLSVQNNLGLSLVFLGKLTDAIGVLAGAAKNPNAGPRTRQNLALTYGLSGDLERAAQVAALDLSPDQVSANVERYRTLADLKGRALVEAILGKTSKGE